MTQSTAPFPSSTITALAPVTLPSYRQLRYGGDDMGVELEQFPPEDQQLLVDLYAALQRLLELLRDQPVVPAQLLARCEELGWDSLMRQLRGLRVPPDMSGDPLWGQAIHDLRGGAMQALAVMIQMTTLGMIRPADLERMFFLTRDQLKIMRNCVGGLDPEGSARDAATRLHDASLLIEKWAATEHYLGERPAQIQVHSSFKGAIAERCLEFSALDRVIYNLINNATRHSANGQVDMWIVPAGDDNLRFAVANPISPEQQRTLTNRFPKGPGALFSGGFSTTGSGLGMRICADFVCNAYGIREISQALSEGHLGATLLESHFVAWFHWPVVGD
ncbi:MAG: ATP-binding protein [Oscillochloridaceae bacterium umkhey_bin13]